jgi:hypothetical protein
MAKKRKSIWLVIQEGGSTGEWYPGTYNSRKTALMAIGGHAKASYRSIGPIKVPPSLTAALTAKSSYTRQDPEFQMLEVIEKVCEGVSLGNFA